MPSVRLVCWNKDLARQRLEQLTAAGFVVDADPLDTGRLIGQFRERPASAVLIDLDRLPSHGREVAVALRRSKTTRLIPIVFAGGAPEKVERIRQQLPDALFTNWIKVAPVLTKALKTTPVAPIQPTAHMERYAGSSLTKKLGFSPGMQVAVLGAPDEFEATLGELPEGLRMAQKIMKQTRLALWFVRSRQQLESETEYVCASLPDGCSLWIIHPKKTGRYKVDFNQNDVRAAGLNAGWVDYKVCAVDVDWSGLKFARSKRVLP
ncbi:MAG: hypothetical protein M3Y27_04340 [Acidobacteriota bacterium]|nr:hypothetical protein [Acidobacteriota bacterium]